MFLSHNDEIVQRLKNYPILRHATDALISQLVSRSEVVELPADTVLFYCSDPGNYVYYMIDGCAEVFASDNFVNSIDLIRSGGMVGQTGVVAGTSNGVAVRIHRFSRVLKIAKDVFLEVFKYDSTLTMELARLMAQRICNMVMNLHEKHYQVRNIVLYVMTSKVSLEKIKLLFKKYASHDQTQVYDKTDFVAANIEMVSFFNKCENNSGVNVFLIDQKDNDIWSKTSLLYVEYVYLLTDEGSWDEIDQEVLDCLRGRPCDIAIWHTSTVAYANTNKFYQRYNFKRHHHLTDVNTSYQRLYRYMTGQAIGLVISGGGFRGYVYYGIIKALLEAKIPIDCIGGSSMGSMLGAGLSINSDWASFSAAYEQNTKELKRKKLFSFTLPIFSLLSGELITNVLRDTYGQYKIEDLPTNFFCVVSNLSKKQKEIKNCGELWEWIRASTAVPGVFPPLEKDGNIYVDGAVCTNLPVLDMRKYLDDAGTIITLDVRLPLLAQNQFSCPPILTLKEALGYKLGLSKKGYKFPRLLDILLESSSINQYIYDQEGVKGADIIIAPDTSSLSFLNPSKGDPLSLIAYEFAQKILCEKKSLYERWL